MNIIKKNLKILLPILFVVVVLALYFVMKVKFNTQTQTYLQTESEKITSDVYKKEDFTSTEVYEAIDKTFALTNSIEKKWNSFFLNQESANQIAMIKAKAFLVKEDYESALVELNRIKFSENSDERNAEVLTEKGAVYKELDKLEDFKQVMEEAITLFPYNADAIKLYVPYLLTVDSSTTTKEQAYNILAKYFKDVDKINYWNDYEMWIHRAFASIATNRCTEAFTSAAHVALKTTSDDRDGIMSGQLMNEASKIPKKECIDEDKFGGE